MFIRTREDNESCSVAEPTAGQWFVSIRGASSYAGMALKVTVFRPNLPG
jgi:hypothetical protein